MAEEQEQKTEQPSQRKLEEAREKGQVTLSRDVVHWAMFLAIGTVVALAPPLATKLAGKLAVIIEQAPTLSLDRLGSVLFGEVAILVAPLLAVMAFAAVAATLIQTGPLASTEKLRPKFSNISPASGWQRIASLRALMEFGKGLLKMVLV